jgi:hypothetical protein
MATPAAGGELVMLTGPAALTPFRNTVERPSFVTCDASAQRQELAFEARALELSLDVAETIDPQNSLERMLAQQMATVHRVGMQLMARVNDGLEHMKAHGENVAHDAVLVRTVAAADHWFGRFQAGMALLHKMRSGHRQHVTVEHVTVAHVANGGQASLRAR